MLACLKRLRSFARKTIPKSWARLWVVTVCALILGDLEPSLVAEPKISPALVHSAIDWPDFMSRQDMVWDRVPTRWEDGPYLGNGMLGLIMFQNPKSPKNEFELHVSRGDYYDNRPP